MSYIEKIDPELYEIIKREQDREHDTLELIASENFTSPAILEAAGGIMTNKYAEGCLLYTSPSPRDRTRSRMPSSA